MKHGPTLLELREREVGCSRVLEVSGELDIYTAPQAVAWLDELTAAPAPRLLVDLRAVDFIDCSGLAVLCRARRRAAQRRGSLSLVIDSPRIRRLLLATRLDK